MIYEPHARTALAMRKAVEKRERGSSTLLGGVRNVILKTIIVCSPAYAHLSHCLRVQLAMIQRETMNTSSTVPGQIVMSVLSTKRVLKLMRFSAPIDRELASVNSFE